MNNKNNVPNHVAIIPDGNRRWANKHNKKPWIGHDEGSKRIEEIIEVAWESGIKCLSIWGSSEKNLKKRPFAEKKALVDIYSTYFERLFNSKDIFEKDVRVNVFGYWREQLPARLVNKIESGLEKTKNNKALNLNFFLAYNGDTEMLDAIKKIINSGVNANDLDGSIVKKNLLTNDLPKVDYLIRTGGEPHLSTGFMMWDTADSQLYFTDKFFPDFDIKSFKESLKEYAKRKRRHGA